MQTRCASFGQSMLWWMRMHAHGKNVQHRMQRYHCLRTCASMLSARATAASAAARSIALNGALDAPPSMGAGLHAGPAS